MPYLHTASCSWNNGTWQPPIAASAPTHSVKPRTSFWAPQIPVCPTFPLLCDQIPSLGLSGPAAQSRQSQACCPDAIRCSHSLSSQGWIILKPPGLQNEVQWASLETVHHKCNLYMELTVASQVQKVLCVHTWFRCYVNEDSQWLQNQEILDFSVMVTIRFRLQDGFRLSI